MAKENIPESNLEKLLSDKRVVAEIERHLWIESERMGYDIGYEKAKEDWLKRFSQAWMEYHMPEELLKSRKSMMSNHPVFEKNIAIEKSQNPPVTVTPAIKRRRAKSYFEMKK